MASKEHNLSSYDPSKIPDGKGMQIGIAISEWNSDITHALYSGAVNTLVKHGVNPNDIITVHVPGSFELIFASSQLLKKRLDAIIAIGCVIRGDTPHFDYICEGTTNGIAHLNATQDIPIIYGLITTNDRQQAMDRSGGSLGNKGDECAITALQMIEMNRKLHY